MALMLGLSSSNAAFADQAETSTTTMENCGAYLLNGDPWTAATDIILPY